MKHPLWRSYPARAKALFEAELREILAILESEGKEHHEYQIMQIKAILGE